MKKTLSMLAIALMLICFIVSCDDSSYPIKDYTVTGGEDGQTSIQLNKLNDNSLALVALKEAVSLAEESGNATIYLNGNEIDLGDDTITIGEVKKKDISTSKSISFDLENGTIMANGLIFTIAEDHSIALKGGNLETKGETLIETAGAIELQNIAIAVVQSEEESAPAIKATEGSSASIVLDNIKVDDSIKSIINAEEFNSTVIGSITNADDQEINTSLGLTKDAVKIGITGYENLASALSELKSNETLTLLSDINNSELSTVQTISLPSFATLNGNGYTISGNVAVYVNTEGGTIINTTFENIHNNTQVVSSFYGFTSDDPKIGNLTAVYASGLAGKLVIKDCTFDSIDWDAIQTTPISGAEIEITGNTFIVDSSRQGNQIRCIHVQSTGTVDFAVTATGNYFYNCTYLNQTGLEVYTPSDLSKVNLSGNYIDSPFGVCIETGDDVSNPTLALPFIDGPNGEEALNPVCYYTANGNQYFDDDFEDALAKVPTNSTNNITLLSNATISNRMSFDYQDLTIDLNGNTITSKDVFDITSGSLTLTNGNINFDVAGIKITTAAITVQSNSTFNVNSINLNSGNGSGIYLNKQSEAIVVNVEDSAITANGAYGISTNATDPNHSNKLELNINKSTVTSDNLALCFNVEGVVTISDSLLEANMQGVLLRGSGEGNTHKISNTTIKAKDGFYDDTDTKPYLFLNGWKSGNSVPIAALIIGNRHSTSYKYPTTVELDKVILITPDNNDLYPYGMYIYQNNNSEPVVVTGSLETTSTSIETGYKINCNTNAINNGASVTVSSANTINSEEEVASIT